MRRLVNILWNSFKMSLDELKNNKLRSGLSLTGVAFGIFCIISVLALVGSLQQKIQDDINSLGTNTIYVDKWEYVNTAEYPWWKFVNRPTPKFEDVKLIEQRSTLAKNVAFFTQNNTTLSYKNTELQFVNLYGVSEEYDHIQKVDIAAGRYFSGSDFMHGNPVAVIGYKNATDLFGGPEYAVGKTVQFGTHRATIIGVIAKQGQSFGPGFDYDNSLMLTYFYYASIFNVNDETSSPFIMVQGKPNVPSQALVDDLEGVMRQVRKLSPKQEDNFALNDVNYIGTSSINSFFGTVNIGGWAIAGLSLIVGAFGVANIMFVTVRERTSQIGLKKAIGAKSRTILLEFLLESAFLCIIGGIIGLLMVAGLAAILNTLLPFKIVISASIIILAFSICVVLGILSGIIPASIAAKMNPVVAIRSK
ncbi:MAG: ABC transporter permease [Bacteroidetes bacterium]|nr:ABC transporter permease [Bacteroidota bacterium]